MSYHTTAIMKKLTVTLVFLVAIGSIAFGWFSFTGSYKKSVTPKLVNNTIDRHVKKAIFKKIKSKAVEAKAYSRSKAFNESVCFLIDMSISSGQNRFFVYDLVKDSIIKSGLVTHGRCNEDWLQGRRYGNTIGCGCTSLGRYKIGHAYLGRFGLAFKLYGLDHTNDKAYERFVVLHAHECVPDAEVSGDICQSDGCPTVSPGFLTQLDPMIKKSGKPVLLWIYN